MAVYLGNEMVSSGGGIGGGSTGGGVFTVNFTRNEDMSYSVDKTYNEITDAFNNNMVVRGYYNTNIYFLTSIKNSNYHMFVGLMMDIGKIVFSTVIVNADNSVIVKDQSATLTSV